MGGRRLTAPRIFLNVGVRSVRPELPGIDEVPTLDAVSIMELDRVPEHLVIVGGSYIGLELAQMMRRFGAEGRWWSGAMLLLNAEGVFTALLAWFVFRENFDRRIALGMLAIVPGAVVLSWPGDVEFGTPWPALAFLRACPALGHRQQPHAQGVALGRDLGGHG